MPRHRAGGGGQGVCAGANFGAQESSVARDPSLFYRQAMRLFRTAKPIVAAVHGAAVGAGVGLALAADFRVTSRDARFSVNFNRLGFHPGFGLSVTLLRLIGEQQAALLFYRGRRIDGARRGDRPGRRARRDWRRTGAGPRAGAGIAISAPLAVRDPRHARQGLADRIAEVNRQELAAQPKSSPARTSARAWAAMAERRLPQSQGAEHGADCQERSIDAQRAGRRRPAAWGTRAGPVLGRAGRWRRSCWPTWAPT